jgi:anti-anti-sigma factor
MDSGSPGTRPRRHGHDTNFAIERQTDADGTTRLILRGELDAATRGDLHAALRAEEHAGAAIVVVLDQLDYLDSAGIAELMRARTEARRAGRRFAVTPGTGNARLVLWIAGVLDDLCAA